MRPATWRGGPSWGRVVASPSASTSWRSIVNQRRPYQRLQNAFRDLGGELIHEKQDRPQGGAWVLYLGGYTLVIPSTQTTRFPLLDACFRLKSGVAASESWEDYTDDINPEGLSLLLQHLLGWPPTMVASSLPKALSASELTRLVAQLKKRLAAATGELIRVLGYSRFPQMESESGTLGACQRVLAPAWEYVDQLTPLWEEKILRESVEAIAIEPEFEPLFSMAELKTARARLTEFGYFSKKRGP